MSKKTDVPKKPTTYWMSNEDRIISRRLGGSSWARAMILIEHATYKQLGAEKYAANLQSRLASATAQHVGVERLTGPQIRLPDSEPHFQ